MTPLSTEQIAQLVGVHRVTLEEWLRKGKVKPPKSVRIGAKTYRLWADKDIERLRNYKGKFYRKGRGRKKKQTIS